MGIRYSPCRGDLDIAPDDSVCNRHCTRTREEQERVCLRAREAKLLVLEENRIPCMELMGLLRNFDANDTIVGLGWK